jgi:Fe-S-cluster containining protein
MNKTTDFSFIKEAATKAEPLWSRYYQKNKKKLEGMDLTVQAIHQDVTKNIDCLNCANCCRTLGPLITNKDVERIAKTLRMKSTDFIDKYLRIDEDGDMVFQSMPCPFLGADNYCSIYEARPKACREYPHTDRKRFYQIYKLSIKNAFTCPIVYEVLQQLTKTSNP